MSRSKIVAKMLGVANGSRSASIGVTEKHVAKVLGLAALHGFAYVFGAKPMTSRAALVVAFLDGDVLRLHASDVRRVDAAKGVSSAIPGFPEGSLGALAEGSKPSARPDYAGVSVLAHALSNGTRTSIGNWMRDHASDVLAVKEI